MQDRQAPKEGGQEQQPVAEHSPGIGPEEGRRIEQRDEAEQAHGQSGQLHRPQPLVQEQHRAGRDPERVGVGQERRAAGRHELHGDRHQDEKGPHLEQPEAEDHRDVMPRRRLELAHGRDQEGEAHAPQQQTREGEPERRDVVDAGLHHRPVHAPDDDQRRQQQIGAPAAHDRGA